MNIETITREPVICEAFIKTATVEDVVRLVVYGNQFWEQTRYFQAGIEYDVETVIEMTNQLIDEGIVLYAEDEKGEIIGLMLVIIAPFLMNKHHLMACEWVFYVDPEYRRGGLGATLILKAEKLLHEKRVTFFTLVSLVNVTPEAAHKLYQSLGFEQSETNFTKVLSWQ